MKKLALSYWRLEKWINASSDKNKLPALSALMSIKEYLDSENVTIIDLDGTRFDNGLNVEVVGVDENAKPCEAPTVAQTVRPIVLVNNTLIVGGQVILSAPLLHKKDKKSSKKQENIW